MFILYAIVAGLVIGTVLGGRPLALGDLKIRWAWLMVGGFLVQMLLFSNAVASRIGDLGPWIYVGSTLLVGAAVLRNIRLPGMPLIAAGALSNMAAILANGMFMPATAEAFASLGKLKPGIYSNSVIAADPKLDLLIDRFAMPAWMPLANVFSVGDVLLGIGVAVLIVVEMRRSPRGRAVAVPGGAALH